MDAEPRMFVWLTFWSSQHTSTEIVACFAAIKVPMSKAAFVGRRGGHRCFARLYCRINRIVSLYLPGLNKEEERCFSVTTRLIELWRLEGRHRRAIVIEGDLLNVLTPDHVPVWPVLRSISWQLGNLQLGDEASRLLAGVFSMAFRRRLYCARWPPRIDQCKKMMLLSRSLVEKRGRKRNERFWSRMWSVERAINYLFSPSRASAVAMLKDVLGSCLSWTVVDVRGGVFFTDYAGLEPSA